MMVVGTDGNGDVCVITNHPVHVLVDLFGAFAADADMHAEPEHEPLIDAAFRSEVDGITPPPDAAGGEGE